MALMPLSYPYYYQHQLLQENENSISINKVYFLVSKTEFLFHWFKGVMYPVQKSGQLRASERKIKQRRQIKGRSQVDEENIQTAARLFLACIRARF